MHPIGSYIGIETTPLDHPHTEAGDAIAFEGQKRVLGMLASGRPADDILAELCRGAEALNPGASAAILVLNRERKCLDRAIAPSASLAFAAALSNIPVGPPHLGTCAAAVFRGEVITCTNVATDARWDPIWTKLYLDYGIQASQSTPIFGSDGLALGTLVLSFPEPQEPDAWNPATIRLSVELASLALERMRALDDLQFFGTSSFLRASQVCTSSAPGCIHAKKTHRGTHWLKPRFYSEGAGTIWALTQKLNMGVS